MADLSKKRRILHSQPTRADIAYPFVFKAKLLSSFSNGIRLEILAIITQKETSVGEIAAQVNKSQSVVSQHLAKLRVDGLVETRKESQTIFYTCRNAGAHKLLRVIREIFSET